MPISWRLVVKNALLWSDCCSGKLESATARIAGHGHAYRRSGQWRIGKATLQDHADRSVAPEAPSTGQWRRKWPQDRSAVWASAPIAIVDPPGPWFASLGWRLSWFRNGLTEEKYHTAEGSTRRGGQGFGSTFRTLSATLPDATPA